MHVLVIPRGLYDVTRMPTQGVFEKHQVSALKAAGLQVGVLSGGVITTRLLGHRFPYVHTELKDQVPIYRAYRRAYLPARWEDPVDSAERSYRRLKPLVDLYMTDYGRPDILHAHNLTQGGLLAKQMSSDFGIPYVVTEHTSTYAEDSEAARRDAAVLRLASRDAHTVVAVGSRLAESLRGALGSRPSSDITVVPNVVDSQLLSCSLRAPHEVFTVAGLGYLIARKNYALLLEAFARADLPRDSRLLIGGDGPEARRLAGIARSQGIEDRVKFAGHLGRDRVVKLLQEADIFAHPSDSESFGVVLIEAMAVGSPVIATASSGPLDIVTPDVGLLSPVGDVGAFTEGLSEMYRRRSEFDPQEVRDACRLRFGPEAFTARMMAIYTEAVS